MSKHESGDTAEETTTESAPGMVPPTPKGVIDPELYQLTMAVVLEMDALVTEYLARDGYKYVPYRSTRTVKAFDSGWPNVALKQNDESRVAHGELFAHKSTNIDPFPYDDVAGMAALKESITTTGSVLERVRPQNTAGTVPADLSDQLMETTIFLFVTSIYDRAKALGLDVTDPATADLYMQREKAWLAPTLEYQLVAPLVLTDIDISDEGLQVDPVTRIERLTDDDLRRMTEVDRFDVKSPLADAAKWAVVVDTPPVKNIGEGRSLFMPDEPIDTSGVNAVCDAIRIVSQARPGWARISVGRGIGRRAGRTTCLT